MLSEELSNAKRRRVARACDVCRRKKVRCDGVQPASDPPSCSNCKIHGHECSFIEAPKKRGPPKGYVDALETRLQRMESIVGGLVKSGRLHENTIRSALAQTNESPRGLRGSLSPPLSDSQPASLEDSRGSYVSSTDDEFSSDSNCSQSDMSEGGHLAADKKGHTKYIGNSSGLFLLKFTKKIVDRQVAVVCDDFHPPKRLDYKSIVSELPPKKVCDQLLDVYWKKCSFYFPIIDRQDFMEKYDNMDTNYNHIILLYAILAVASNFVDSSSVPGIDYYDRADELLREEFDNSTLEIIQALLLLSGNQKDLRTPRAWMFVGLAIRLAQDMGLHRDSSNWNINEKEAEVRRRVWWACVAFDSFLGIALGLPLAINEEDYDVRFPEAGKLFYDQPDSIEMFTQYIKASLIISRVSRHIYGINSKQTESTLSNLDAELNEWHENLPPRLRLKESDDLMIVSVDLIYYTIQILLHRPHIRCPKSKAPPSSIPSLTICTVAASNITHIMYRTMRKGVINFKWKYTLYGFFTAVTMHIINALSDDERFREVAKQGLRMSVKCLEHMMLYFKELERFLHILNDLLKIKNVNLDGPDGEISNQKVSDTKDENSANDSRCNHLCFTKDTEVGSHSKSFERPRITFASSHSVSRSPQPVDHEQSSDTGGREMNYEYTYSSGSLPFVPSIQFNDSNGFSGFNELFPPNANAFIPETSSLLFDNVGNNYGLSVPNTVDWTEWSNWTEYMMKLRASANNSQ